MKTLAFIFNLAASLVNFRSPLIQYMACGKPVTTSPVGVNRDVVASTADELLNEAVAKGVS